MSKNTFIHESIFIIDDSKRKKKCSYQTFPISRAKSKDCTKKHAFPRAFCICYVSYRFLYSTNSGFTPSFSYVHTSRKSMPATTPKQRSPPNVQASWLPRYVLRSSKNCTVLPFGRVYARFTVFPSSAYSVSTVGRPSICSWFISRISWFLNSSNCPLSLSVSYRFQ